MGRQMQMEDNVQRRRILFSPPDIGEREIAEVTDVLRSGWITTGPRTKRLERRLAAYIRTGNHVYTEDVDAEVWDNKVVCLNSATAAEELNLRIFGVGPGDEVIVPAYTYTASAAAAMHVGANVVFVDTVDTGGAGDTHAPEMDYEAVAAAINSKTKAIVAVDLGGVICDYKRLRKAVESRRDCFVPCCDRSDGLKDLSSRLQRGLHRAAIFADSAHALGAWRVVDGNKWYAGQLADFTSFSFHAVKNLTTAEGGASTWKLPSSCYKGMDAVTDKEIYHYYQLLSLHGQSKDAFAKSQAGLWEYDIVGPWYKCNMTDIMAAIGLGQLDRYAEMLERRRQIIEIYDNAVKEFGVQHLIHSSCEWESGKHLYLARIPGITSEQRSKLIKIMAERGIACNVHYKPLPLMTAYQKLGWDIKHFPHAYGYYENVISLPLHTLLSDSDVNFIVEELRGAMRKI